jgi:hypothetical protein
MVSVFCNSRTVEDGGISVHPNPNRGHFFIRLPSEESCALRLYNSLGEVVYKDRCTHTLIREISPDKIVQGIYFLKIETDKLAMTVKVIIQ